MMMMMMHLSPQAFDKVEHGRKRLELRLHDGKRRALRLGDDLCLAEAGGNRVVHATVTGLLAYPDFAALAADVLPAWLGNADGPLLMTSAGRERLVQAMLRIYTPGQVRQHGVLGIRFRVDGDA